MLFLLLEFQQYSINLGKIQIIQKLVIYNVMLVMFGIEQLVFCHQYHEPVPHFHQMLCIIILV